MLYEIRKIGDVDITLLEVAMTIDRMTARVPYDLTSVQNLSDILDQWIRSRKHNRTLDFEIDCFTQAIKPLERERLQTLDDAFQAFERYVQQLNSLTEGSREGATLLSVKDFCLAMHRKLCSERCTA